MERSAVYGLYLHDEPGKSKFPALKIWSDAVREEGMLPYINLFPNYGTARQYETPDYETYLDEYVRICQPDYLSYDHYALNENLNYEN